ncbi:MAG: hypothetical protein CL606_03925 [Anaerolineaceae bacterium]|nr:hypothetical protein [Anaerolineaceae bacterium]|tara:strand:- start:2943 stop:5033 length:2091 start_codon:yes stop_codon:yes gene_type:complete
MIPIKLELTNFLPYKDTQTLDFNGIHVACLVGDNGSGKSSLLEAMVWALWGKARDGKRSDDELIHHGETEMRVLLIFQLTGNKYRIVRQRKVGKSGQLVLALHVYDNSTESWRDLSEAGSRQTQRKIDELLCIDYDTFMNSAFVAQGRADEFTIKSPSNRKAVLASILGLDQWDIFQDRARQYSTDLNEDLRILDSDIESIDRDLSSRSDAESELSKAEASLAEIEKKTRVAEKDMADVEQARQGLAHTRRVIDDLTARIRQDESELSSVESELSSYSSEADKTVLEAELDNIKSRLSSLKTVEIESKDVLRQRTEASEYSARLKGENKILESEGNKLKSRIKMLDTATEPICPTCGQVLEGDSVMVHLQTELKERRSRYSTQRDSYEKLDEKVRSLDKTLSNLDQTLKEQNKLERRLAEVELRISNTVKMSENFASMEARRKRWQDNLVEDRNKLNEMEIEQARHTSSIQASEERQKHLNDLRGQQRLWTEKVGSARQKISALDNLVERRKSRVVERDRVADQIGIYSELYDAFGKEGVPAMIIEAAVPEIENTTNELLGKMTYGRMNVRFDTQRALKSGDTKETLDIKIADDLGTRNYELYSGGESFRVNFAIRIALSKLLARRSGAQLQTVVIDEGFGTQDSLGRQKLVEAINTIQDDFKRVLVITHIDELKDIFPVRINIVKTSEGSKIALG